MGLRSDIWCRGAFDDVRSECHLLDELSPRPRPDTWWLYHLSSGSPAADLLAARSEPLLVDYHNITPSHFFDRWLDWAKESADQGRRQLGELAGRAFFSLADSAYNAAELDKAGYASTTVVPPLFDLDVAVTPDAATLARRRHERDGGGSDWLFVGRVAPSKAQHDIVKAFACYRRVHDPSARLHLVGTGLGEAYPAAVRRFAERLGIADAVRLTGAVTEGELAAHYLTADVFVCLSEHEGFCIPVVEAMHAGLPVVAFGAAAVPDTVGGAGLVLDDKSPLVVAEAVARVLSDDALHTKLTDAGRARAQSFSLARGKHRWEGAVEEAISAGVHPR
ncbi:MAG: glycosyltransferase family 4 protein, partial [Acidimicrobiales bacterium]